MLQELLTSFVITMVFTFYLKTEKKSVAFLFQTLTWQESKETTLQEISSQLIIITTGVSITHIDSCLRYKFSFLFIFILSFCQFKIIWLIRKYCKRIGVLRKICKIKWLSYQDFSNLKSHFSSSILLSTISLTLLSY